MNENLRSSRKKSVAAAVTAAAVNGSPSSDQSASASSAKLNTRTSSRTIFATTTALSPLSNSSTYSSPTRQQTAQIIINEQNQQEDLNDSNLDVPSSTEKQNSTTPDPKRSSRLRKRSSKYTNYSLETKPVQAKRKLIEKSQAQPADENLAEKRQKVQNTNVQLSIRSISNSKLDNSSDSFSSNVSTSDASSFNLSKDEQEAKKEKELSTKKLKKIEKRLLKEKELLDKQQELKKTNEVLTTQNQFIVQPMNGPLKLKIKTLSQPTIIGTVDSVLGEDKESQNSDEPCLSSIKTLLLNTKEQLRSAIKGENIENGDSDNKNLDDSIQVIHEVSESTKADDIIEKILVDEPNGVTDTPKPSMNIDEIILSSDTDSPNKLKNNLSENNKVDENITENAIENIKELSVNVLPTECALIPVEAETNDKNNKPEQSDTSKIKSKIFIDNRLAISRTKQKKNKYSCQINRSKKGILYEITKSYGN